MEYLNPIPVPKAVEGKVPVKAGNDGEAWGSAATQGIKWMNQLRLEGSLVLPVMVYQGVSG